MFGNKKKIEELKAKHEADLKVLQDQIDEMQSNHETELQGLGEEKDSDKDQALEQQLKDSNATVQTLLGQVKSMGEKLNVLESIPELIHDELKKKGIENLNLEDIKTQLLKDAQDKSEEQQIQEDAANAEFEDEFDKALENVNV